MSRLACSHEELGQVFHTTEPARCGKHIDPMHSRNPLLVGPLGIPLMCRACVPVTQTRESPLMLPGGPPLACLHADKPGTALRHSIHKVCDALNVYHSQYWHLSNHHLAHVGLPCRVASCRCTAMEAVLPPASPSLQTLSL